MAQFGFPIRLFFRNLVPKQDFHSSILKTKFSKEVLVLTWTDLETETPIQQFLEKFGCKARLLFKDFEFEKRFLLAQFGLPIRLFFRKFSFKARLSFKHFEFKTKLLLKFGFPATLFSTKQTIFRHVIETTGKKAVI